MNEQTPPMGDNSGGGPGAGVTFACRCEEVRDEEVVAAIVAGARSVDDVKRRTRAGMGMCQGVYCMPVIAAVVAQATGTPVERLGPMTSRPPVRPIALEALADLYDGEDESDNAPTGDGR